jgi:hypothetical protein
MRQHSPAFVHWLFAVQKIAESIGVAASCGTNASGRLIGASIFTTGASVLTLFGASS